MKIPVIILLIVFAFTAEWLLAEHFLPRYEFHVLPSSTVAALYRCDKRTGEVAVLLPGRYASADLRWVCPAKPNIFDQFGGVAVPDAKP